MSMITVLVVGTLLLGLLAFFEPWNRTGAESNQGNVE